MISIALVQPDLQWEDRELNLKSLSGILRDLEPPDLILLPELFATGFSMKSRELGESMDGPSMQWMSRMSGELGSSIAGSLILGEGGSFYNRLVWMHRDGSYQFYDKRHLFRMGGENEHYSGGNRRVIVQDFGFRFLPLVCYDLRFPVWSRNREDYDVLVYLSNWPAPRHEVWTSLLKARAIENQCFVIGSVQTAWASLTGAVPWLSTQRASGSYPWPTAGPIHGSSAWIWGSYWPSGRSSRSGRMPIPLNWGISRICRDSWDPSNPGSCRGNGHDRARARRRLPPGSPRWSR